MGVIVRIATGSCVGILCAGLLAQLEFARPNSARSGKQRLLAARTTTPAAVKPAPPAPHPETSKAIVILETRDHRITVLGTSQQGLLYSVATPEGFTLAESLSADGLRDRFPQLYEVVTGTAWAGL